MAPSGAIRAGRAFVELFADDSKLVSGLRRVSARLKAFGTGVRNIGLKMTALGAAVTAPLVAAAKAAADSVARLWDVSRRTGMSVEALSALAYAAELTGSDLETLETGVRRMQKSIAGVADEAEGTTGNLDHLGLALHAVAGLNPAQQFALIAGRIAQIADPTERAAAAMKVFGRSGTMLLPMMERLDELVGQAKDFGFIKSAASAKEAKDFAEVLTIAAKAVKSLVVTVGAALIPILKEKSKWIMQITLLARDWIKKNQGLVVSIFQLAAGAVAVGTGLSVLGTIISKLGVVLGLVAAAVKIVGAILAWMITPVGLVITAVAALGAYILYATGAGAKALSWLGARFNELKDDAVAAYGGIADALAAGDIGLAAKILWLTLKLEWTKGVNWISGIWNGALLWLRRRATEVFYGLVMGLEYIWHGLEVAWIETTAFLSKVWTGFCAGIHHAWLWVVKSLEETWNHIKALFDDGFDAGTANAAVEKQYEQARDQMWNQAKQQLGEREAERARQRESARQTHEGTISELYRQGEAEKQRLQDEYGRKMKTNQEELDAARKEWRDSLDQAKKKRQEKEAQGPQKMHGPEDLLAGLGAGLGDLLDQTKKTIGASGTFNAAALLGLQVGGADDRIATATERTAKGIEGLRQDVKNNKPAFV